MRLAISTSPSRVRSETEPIFRRYMRTGSLLLPMASSTSAWLGARLWGGTRFRGVPSSSSSSSPVGTGLGSKEALEASSTTSISFSPNIIITSSSCWEEMMSSGSASLTSS